MDKLKKLCDNYTCQLPLDKSRDFLTAIRKLIVSNAQSDEDTHERFIECTDMNNQNHVYSYFAMDDEFKARIPKNMDTYDFFKHRYTLVGQSHTVVAAYLKKHRYDSYRAITSLCYGDGSYFLHSYIWHEYNNRIFDFSRNIIMDKEQYDRLFVYKEINSLTYDEYDYQLGYYGYMLCGKDYCRLVYLAFHKLYEELYGEEYVAPADLNVGNVLGRVFNRY